MATQAFLAGWRGYTDPTAPSSAHDRRLSEYRLFWALYENSIFDRSLDTLWRTYKQEQRLASFIRSIDNITPKLVDFYRGAVYPGVLSADGQDLPDGVPSMVELAVPAANAARADDLKAAVAQILRWSNFQQTQADYVMWGAALGEVALEAVDLVDRSKVQIVPRYPGEIAEFELGDEGNVTYYATEFERVERTRSGSGWTEERYQYRKEVDREEIRYFKDGSPFAYGDVPAVIPNPYEFVPLVWVRHESRGGDRGAPAIAGSLPTYEAINHLLAVLMKDIEKVSRSPYVLVTDDTLSPALSAAAEAALAGAEIKLDMLKTNNPGSGFPIESGMQVAAVLELIVHLTKTIERNHPEATMWERLREMSQITGPAARRLIGDTLMRVARVSANYDDGLVRACQMTLSMAAIRRPEWQQQNDAQKAAAKFTPQSYAKGELDFTLQPRNLVPEIESERWDSEIKRAQVATDWSAITNSKVFGMDRAGFSKPALEEFFKKNAELIAAERLIAGGDLDADGEPPPQQ